jgi:hypothetical protein
MALQLPSPVLGDITVYGGKKLFLKFKAISDTLEFFHLFFLVKTHAITEAGSASIDTENKKLVIFYVLGDKY